MGAAGLLDIKKRIKSVESTRKITNAVAIQIINDYMKNGVKI